MKNLDQAKNYFNDASDVYEEAKQALEHKNYNLTIRRSQEAVELAIKGLLMLRGIDTPPTRDVSQILLSIPAERLNINKENIEKMAEISHILAQESKTAYYGMKRDSDKDLFTAERAKQAIEQVKLVLNNTIKASLK